VLDASHRNAIEGVERELFPTVPKSDDRVNEEESGSAEDSEDFGGASRINGDGGLGTGSIRSGPMRPPDLTPA
jgi:hypothetical protein